MEIKLENVQNTIVGSTVTTGGGDVIINGNKVTNIFYSVQYQDLKKQLDELIARFEKTHQRLEKYPDDADFKAELQQIDTERRVVQQKIDDLRKEVIKLATDFQKIPLNTERLRLAKQHFETGDFAAARAVLDAETMGGELDALLSEKENLQNRQAENEANLLDKANEFLILAQLTNTEKALPDYFEKAKGYFEQSLKAACTAENLFSYAGFLQDNNQLGAEELYEELFSMLTTQAAAAPGIYQADLASTAFNLAIVYKKVQKMAESEKMYQFSIEHYGQLAQKEPEIYETDLANVFMSVGNFYADVYNTAEAENMFLRCMEIFKRLAQKDAVLFEPELAMTNMNMGVFYAELEDYAAAEKMYGQALAIYERLSKDDPEQYEASLALTATNLGVMLSDDDRLEAAEKLYQRALGIYERLAAKNPLQFEHELSNTLMNFGILKKNTEQMAEAESLLLRALKINERLAKSNPNQFNEGLANALMNLGCYYVEVEHPEKAEELYLRAVEIFEQLKQNNPAQHERILAQTLMNVADFYNEIEKTPECEAMFQRCVKEYEYLVEVDPEKFEQYLAVACGNFGKFYGDTERPEQQEEMYLRSLEIYERLVQQEAFYEPDLVKVIVDVADCYVVLGENAKAEKYFSRGLEIYERLHKSDSAAFETDFSDALGSYANFYLYSNNYPAAQKTAEKAITIDRTNNFVRTTLGHAILLQTGLAAAQPIYKQFIDEEEDSEEAKMTLVEGLENLESYDITSPEFAIAVAWLTK